MKTESITLNPNINEAPVYMSHEQFEDSYYIPLDRKIVIMDFKENKHDDLSSVCSLEQK